MLSNAEMNLNLNIGNFFMSENLRIPPIVEQYIDKLIEPRNNRFQRDIACQMLETIVSSCQDAINEYRRRNKNGGW